MAFVSEITMIWTIGIPVGNHKLYSPQKRFNYVKIDFTSWVSTLIYYTFIIRSFHLKLTLMFNLSL